MNGKDTREAAPPPTPAENWTPGEGGRSRRVLGKWGPGIELELVVELKLDPDN
jgi:hypothetical protein